MRAILFVLAGCAMFVCACHRPIGPPRPLDGSWHTAHAAWIREREKKLTEPDGWLCVIGLHWLKEGENGIGADPKNLIRFPDTSPPFIGTITLREGRARLKVDPVLGVLANGKAVEKMDLQADDVPGVPPDRVSLGPVSFVLIKRGDKLGVRVFDRDSVARRTFKGIERFEPSERYRVWGRFEPYSEPRIMDTATAIRTVEKVPVAGEVVFDLDGERYRLTATQEPGGHELFIVFADPTNGKETYPGGRFLTVPAPGEDRMVDLDFNRAYNPPCAFTRFATCPLPRPQDRLPVPILAGEKVYHAEERASGAGE